MIRGRHSKAGTRLGVGLSAGIAALATAAALAGSGAAQTSGTELHLVATSQPSAEFFPKHRPHPGDQLGFGDKITGDDTGVDRAVCTIVAGSNGLPCTIWVKLSKGSLELQGMAPEKSHNSPIAVVGGTGAYDGARGTAFVTDVSKTKTNVVVDLLP
jgi:Dirigent-like protein